jgi:hypothetical protein
MLGCRKHFHMTASTKKVCSKLANTDSGSRTLSSYLSEFATNAQGLDCHWTSLKIAIVNICEFRQAMHLRRPFD